MTQVVRPILPYRGQIPGGIHDGKIIEIRGTPIHGGDMFAFNLLTGLDIHSDRALHVSVRFNQRLVVRNHLEMHSWGPEETSGIFPFHKGQEFTMKILVDSSSYKIAVNEQHCWEFVHRIPTMRVTSILIEGHIQIERIEYIDRNFRPGTCYPAGRISPGYDQYQPGTCGVYPAGGIDPGFNQYQPGTCGVYPSGRISPGYNQYQPGVCGIPPTPAYPARRVSPGVCVMPGISVTPSVPTYPTLGQGIGTGICPPPEQICPQPAFITPGRSNLAPVYNPSIPYAYPIYGGLKLGMTIHISGRPTAGANRFTINLQSGTSPYPPPELAFHMDVRFFSRSVCRNSRTNNVWQREESIASHFPFQHGVHFEMIVRVDPDRFMVAVNGQHFVEFRHRLHPLERFDTLYIENDVQVDSIRFT